MELAISRLHATYLEHGDSASACGPALAVAGESLRQLDLVAARLSIRRGGEADVTILCHEVGTHGEVIVGAISRHLALPANAEGPPAAALKPRSARSKQQAGASSRRRRNWSAQRFSRRRPDEQPKIAAKRPPVSRIRLIPPATRMERRKKR